MYDLLPDHKAHRHPIANSRPRNALAIDESDRSLSEAMAHRIRVTIFGCRAYTHNAMFALVDAIYRRFEVPIRSLRVIIDKEGVGRFPGHTLIIGAARLRRAPGRSWQHLCLIVSWVCPTGEGSSVRHTQEHLTCRCLCVGNTPSSMSYFWRMHSI